AWIIHFRIAQRAALRSVEERGSALRSFYLHLVVFVTALLVFGYGQRALRLVLQGAYLGDGTQFSQFGPGAFGLEAEWPARAAGAAAMALTAALVLAYHLRLSTQDRRAVPIAGRAAELRHLALYGLAAIGLFWAASTTVSTLAGVWARIADEVAPIPGFSNQFVPPPGIKVTHRPSQADVLRFKLIGAVPAILGWLVPVLGLLMLPHASRR